MPKRTYDTVFSFIGLIAAFPLLFLIALLIKLDSAGPVFYRGVRVGYKGKQFRLYKFRSMIVNAEQIGGSSTADDDPRLTKVGRFLRKHKLDELPQLINVLKGDMSFVGPRPEVQHYVDLFTEQERLILSVRPGITDLASLWNSDEGAILAGSPDPDKAYMEKIRPEKIRLQLEYIRTRSFWTDILIMLQTVAPMISLTKPKAGSVMEDKGSGSYED